MTVHLERYPNTPCGVPMCRAGIVTKHQNKVTCESCVVAVCIERLREAEMRGAA